MKQYILVFMFLSGIFGPLFAHACENSTKDISLHLSHRSAKTKHIQTGIASWYGPGFHGRPMANGRPYNAQALTIAHRTLPLGQKICVRNLENGKAVEVKVTDRGPYIPGRIVDLSEKTAEELGMKKQGVMRVSLTEVR